MNFPKIDGIKPKGRAMFPKVVTGASGKLAKETGSQL